MKLRTGRRFRYSDEYTDQQGRRIHYDDESMFYITLEAKDVAAIASSGPSKRWVHLIPVVVILCFVILWMFSSHPGSKAKVAVKDGRNESVLHTEIPREAENGFRTDQAPPENATSPFTSKSSGSANNNEDSTWTLRNLTDSKPTGYGRPAPDIDLMGIMWLMFD